MWVLVLVLQGQHQEPHQEPQLGHLSWHMARQGAACQQPHQARDGNFDTTAAAIRHKGWLSSGSGCITQARFDLSRY